MLSVAPILLALAASPSEDAIVWLDTLEAAHAESAKDGRPIVAYFTYQGCGSCDLLSQRTFTDPAVVAGSRRFHWVSIDRDQMPNVVARFHVEAFPELCVLGPADENIHRFRGYLDPVAFRAELEDALRRNALFQAGKPWDERAPRPDAIIDGAEIERIPVPSKELGQGIAFVEQSLFVVQGTQLFRLDPKTGAVRASFSVPVFTRDICTDGVLIYCLPWGWSKGDPIAVVDPANGATVYEIVTRANAGRSAMTAQGIAWRDKELWVLTGPGQLQAVDPETGELKKTLRAPPGGTCLDFDGDHFVVGSHKALLLVSPESGAVVGKIESNYPISAVGWNDGRYYLMEYEVKGFDRAHRPIRLWPDEMVVHAVRLRRR